MKRVLLLVLFLSVLSWAYPRYYWDEGRFLGKDKPGFVHSGVRGVETGGSVLVFTLIREKGVAELQYYEVRSPGEVEGPNKTGIRIPVRAGFYPHFDAALFRDVLYLAFNTIDGEIFIAEKGEAAEKWSRPRKITGAGGGPFVSDLSLQPAGPDLWLFYHSEKEKKGRSIGFSYMTLRAGSQRWEGPMEVGGDFAGAFFPSLHPVGGEYYLFWQARPFSSGSVPVFDIYLSRASTPSGPWSEPLNLTRSAVSEDEVPRALVTDDRFLLVWESDREGVRGVYYAEFNPEGKPLTEPVKVNGSPFTARNARIVEHDGTLSIFFMDDRNGGWDIYQAVRDGDIFTENGPVGRVGAGSGFLPVIAAGDLFLLWNDGGIRYAGPDRAVKAPVFVSTPRYIGINGVRLRWNAPEDPQGLEGYCYIFDENEDNVPEIVNIPPEVRTINVKAAEEGRYYFHFRAKDSAGNLSETVTLDLEADLTPPSPPVIGPVNEDEEGYLSGEPFLSWEPAPGEDVRFRYRLVKRDDDGSSPVFTEEKRIDLTGMDGGEWLFSVESVDRAGNVSELSKIGFRLRPAPTDETADADVETALSEIEDSGRRERANMNIKNTAAVGAAIGGFLLIAVFATLSIVKHRSKGVRIMARENRKKIGLRFKFSLLIGGLVLLITVGISVVLSFVMVEHEKRALAEQMMEKAELSLSSMAAVAREGLLNEDDLLLLSVIAKTMENTDIRYSAIIDTEKRVIAHSDMGLQGSVLSEDFPRRAAESAEKVVSPAFTPEELLEVYDLGMPVQFAGTRIGTVLLGYSSESIFRTIGAARRKNLVNTVIITIITIVVGILGAVILATVTITPIKELAAGVNIIGGGNLEHRIHVRARDEIGMLADEFNRMTSRLGDYQREMAQKAKLDEQIDIARKIQQDLIPGAGIETRGLSIHGFYRAAAGVGGDYYDFIQIDNDHYGLIISDVAGKGVPASLMMIMIRTVFRSLIQTGMKDPAQIVTLINRMLAPDIADDRFATLLFGVYNRRSRLFRYANAGYGPLLVFRRKERECTLIKPTVPSLPVGVMEDTVYNAEKYVKLAQGDSVFLLTDGVHEARNGKDEEYGMERLLHVIPALSEGTGNIADGIIADVLKFAGKARQHDDMTLLVLDLR